MTELIYVALGVFTLYLLLIYKLFGWIPSISDSYYEFAKKYGSKYTWVFTIVLWVVALTTMMSGLELSKNSNVQFLMFLSTAGICFTAAAPQFKRGVERDVHYIGAFIRIILGTLMVGILFKLWVVMGLLIVSLLLIVKANIKNFLYWVEVIAFYTIILSIIYIKIFGS